MRKSFTSGAFTNIFYLVEQITVDQRPYIRRQTKIPFKKNNPLNSLYNGRGNTEMDA